MTAFVTCENCKTTVTRQNHTWNDGDEACPACKDAVWRKECSRCHEHLCCLDFNRDGRNYRSECRKCQRKVEAAWKQTARGREKKRAQDRRRWVRIKMALAVARSGDGPLPGRVTSVARSGDGPDVIPPRPKAPTPGPKPASAPKPARTDTYDAINFRPSDWPDPERDPRDHPDVPFALLRDPRFEPFESSTWPDDDDPVYQGPNARKAGWC